MDNKFKRADGQHAVCKEALEEHGAADEAAAEPQAQVEVAAEANAELGSATFTKWLGIASFRPSARETICKRPVKISSLDS